MSEQISPPQATSLAVLPLRRGVLLTGVTTNIAVGRAASLTLLSDHDRGDCVAVAVQRDPRTESPGREDLHPIAVRARIRHIKQGSKGVSVTLQGLQRVELQAVEQQQPYLVTQVEETDASPTEEATMFAAEAQSMIQELAKARDIELPDGLLAEHDPGRFADRIATLIELEDDRRLEVLQTVDPVRRLQVVIEGVKEIAERWDLRNRIGSQVRKELTKQQRRAILQQQLRAIKNELSEGSSGKDSDDLRSRIDELQLPEEVREPIDRDLDRFESIEPSSPEHHIIRNYLELIADLPWNERAEIDDDVSHVSEHLDRDHHGLDEVKQRVLEHLAVAKLSGDPQGTILCLVGPPGVGKTSLAQSVADASGRPLVRVSLGGVRDEAELRGHRRTYVGALAGRIINAMRKSKVKNPVIVLDEIDKLSRGMWGSPEAALLEILDPEQNHAFTDHYLDVPFDLSEAMFITTANSLETISAPLRDRLEVIEVSGYTTEEKTIIAERHLLPKRIRRIGLHEDGIRLGNEALGRIVRDYTREAGVRQLDRQLTKLVRGVALRVVKDQHTDAPTTPIEIGVDDLQTYLGRPKHREEIAERVALPGVATGLAWTLAGGDILFVETSRMPGSGKLQITGKLGDVMQESAHAALTYVRSHADDLGIEARFLRDQDIHVHVPAGAVPKDGPSAGVTIFTALTSLLTGRRIRPDTAMTGECSLRGRVLPVGGIKEKVAAAHRAGIERVVLPRRNEADLDDVPEEVRDTMDFVLVDDMAEVLEATLEPIGVIAPEDEVSASLGSSG